MYVILLLLETLKESYELTKHDNTRMVFAAKGGTTWNGVFFVLYIVCL